MPKLAQLAQLVRHVLVVSRTRSKCNLANHRKKAFSLPPADIQWCFLWPLLVFPNQEHPLAFKCKIELVHFHTSSNLLEPENIYIQQTNSFLIITWQPICYLHDFHSSVFHNFQCLFAVSFKSLRPHKVQRLYLGLYAKVAKRWSKLSQTCWSSNNVTSNFFQGTRRMPIWMIMGFPKRGLRKEMEKDEERWSKETWRGWLRNWLGSSIVIWISLR